MIARQVEMLLSSFRSAFIHLYGTDRGEFSHVIGTVTI
jgi:hypothetical protein